MSKESKSCYHCGESCPTHAPVLQEKHFCCEGCKSVYEILQGNGLDNYYKIERTPGISASGKKANLEFDYLDQQEAFEKLISFQQGNRVHINLRVPQIHCASCVWLLENLYKLHPGILKSEVRFLKRSLSLQFDLSQIKLSEIAALIASLGYAPDINLQDLDEEPKAKKDHSFYYRLGIAGFCTGNIMLMSFPEYLGLEDHSFQHFFAYINLALAIPILFYSAAIFFQSAFQGLKIGRLNIDVPVSLGILALFAQSLYDILWQIGPGYLDSLAGLVFFLLLGRWFQQKSFEQLHFDRNFRSYFPLYAKKVGEHGEESVLLSHLVKGDILQIKNEEIIPADAILLEEEAYLDYSFVSGESVPQAITKAEKIFAGAKLLGKGVKVQLLKAVSESYLSELWKGYKKSKDEKAGIPKISDQLAKHFTLFILLLSLISGIYWYIQEDLAFALQVSIAILIVACPCGLALSSPIVLGNAMRILGRNGFFLRDSHLLENISKLKHWVFDKTGTLTLTQQTQDFEKLQALSPKEKSLVLALSQESNHPISQRIAMELADSSYTDLRKSTEYPGLGLKGLSDHHTVLIGKPDFMKAEIGKSLGEGLTGIALDGELIAELDREEKPREKLGKVLADLGQDYQLSILSGDANSRVSKLKAFFPPGSSFHGEKLPQEKLDYVKKLQQVGTKVIMMGDGLNDAGALMQADLGIVLSEQLESFSPASDVILDSKSFSRLPALMKYARNTQKLLIGALIISLIYNTIGLGFAIQGLLSPLIAAILMPLSSISVILWGMGSTFLLAKKMGL